MSEGCKVVLFGMWNTFIYQAIPVALVVGRSRAFCFVHFWSRDTCGLGAKIYTYT